MELLLAPGRREGLRLIREQLCCALCGRIFEDPQCLDCKHNFCRACIFARLRSRESKCPTCGIPVFPSDVTRNQFLQSILAAWKAVEHELALLEAHGGELGISVVDTDRALGSSSNSSCASPPASRVAPTSTGAAIAAALVHTPLVGTPARKWNVDTAAIRNELLPPKQSMVTGVAASPPRAHTSETPGLTQMTQMTQMPTPAPRIANHRRRNLFSPAQGLAAASSLASGESESESMVPVMATQELEGYLERIQMQNRALSQWEQHRKSDAVNSRQQQEQLNQNLSLSQTPKPRGKPRKPGPTSAMKKLMQSWVASGGAQADAKPDDGDKEEEDDASQTQLLHAGGSYTDSPDLLANSGGGGAFSRLDALIHTRVARDGNQRRRQPSLGLEAVSTSKSTMSLLPASGHSATPRTKARRSRAADGGTKNDNDDDKDDNEEEVENSQLSGSLDLRQRRKKQRVSRDFDGAISAFHEARTQQQPKQPDRTVPGGSVVPVARIDSEKQHLLSGALVPRAAAPGCENLLALAPPRSSKPLRPSAARQIAADIRKASGFTLVATDLTAAECKRVSTACALLGGRFGLSFDLRPDPVSGVLCSSVTHLIAKTVPAASGGAGGGRRCKRTAKYMRALAEGCLVMDYAWVEASLAAGRWLDEEEFEMVGDAYSSSVGKPRESHVRRMATGRRHDLFQSFRFVLLCDEHEFDYQIDTLSGVVENFGGAVISAAHFLNQGAARRAGKTHVGIVGRATAPADAKNKWQQFQIPIVRVAWLFECISHLEIVAYEDFYPYF